MKRLMFMLLGFLVVIGDLPAEGQIVSGGAPAVQTPPERAADERVRLAAKFADFYRSGRVGDAIGELADRDMLFTSMFGKEDWSKSTTEEREELTALYIESMNLAHRRSRDETPDPVSQSDISVTEDSPHAARVGITFRVKGSPTRFMLRLRLIDEQWRIVDGYAVGEDSWTDNMRKIYHRMRGKSTPVAVMRQVHELITDMSRGQATTRPSD